MTLTQKITVLGIALLMAVAGVMVLVPAFAHANPSFFIRSGNGTPSTPLGFMSIGKATTTIPFDLGVGGAQGADSAILALQLIGSTTPSNAAVATTTYNVALEYSADNVDWYSAGLATTTQLGWETTNGVLVASTTATKVYVTALTPTRYIRAVVSIPQGSNNGSVWGEFIAKRQSN